jgi:hypothetical protein
VNAADEISRQLSKIQNVNAGIVGVYAGPASGDMAYVDVDDNRVPASVVSAYYPIPGEEVRMMKIGSTLLILGPLRPRSRTGRVSAVGTTDAIIEYPPGSGVTKTMGIPKGYSPTVNDAVLIDWDSGGTVDQVVTKTPDYTAPEAPKPPTGTAPIAPKKVTKLFRAHSDSGTYQNGQWWQSQIWASASTSGAWFYGNTIKDTIPDNARIISVRLHLLPVSLSGNPPILRAHTHASRPGGGVNFSSETQTLSADRDGVVTINNGFGDFLKSNTGGVGFDHGGYNKYKALSGPGKHPDSGALEITWEA